MSAMIQKLDSDLLRQAKNLVPRAAAALILLGGIAVIWSLCVEPWRQQYQANAQQISDESRIVSRLKAIVALEPTLSASPDNADETTFSGNFLAGTEDTLVVAELQTKLRSLAVSHKTQLNSARTLPAKTVDGLTYIGLKLELRGDLRDIQQIIHGIETSEPFLFVEKLTLRPSNQPGFGRPPTSQNAAQLLAELDIFGAKWPRVPSATGTSK